MHPVPRPPPPALAAYSSDNLTLTLTPSFFHTGGEGEGKGGEGEGGGGRRGERRESLGMRLACCYVTVANTRLSITKKKEGGGSGEPTNETSTCCYITAANTLPKYDKNEMYFSSRILHKLKVCTCTAGEY